MSTKETGRELYRDRIRGSLFGGAVGDALGYQVEFMKEGGIFRQYGEDGICEYELDPASGKALISDDTQMTLFTAVGLLVGDTRGCMRGLQASPRSYVQMAYQDWLITQKYTWKTYSDSKRKEEWRVSWLLDVPELFSRRAPGNTCLAALEQQEGRVLPEDYIANPQNHSKGCGGIMRVAPAALDYRTDMKQLDWEGAQIAAITHGHSLGYMPAAVQTHIVNRLVFGGEDGKPYDLLSAVKEAKETADELFRGDKHLKELDDIIDLAVRLSQNNEDDLDNIHRIGAGWVAEETLGIALYCALKYQDDFSHGVIAAVNHNGDSDSTGAVAGNILGALLGYNAIEDKWKKDLELSDVILEVADDLCDGCRMSECGDYYDPAWTKKYIDGHRYKKQKPCTFFWHEYAENGFMSNWYEAPFIIGDFEYRWVEQYMMSQKAVLFHDAVTNTKILRASSPKECKDLGKDVEPFDSEKWDAEKYRIVLEGNRAKYQQHPELLEKLLETGDSILAEASPYDKIWGIKLKKEDSEKMQPEDWPGGNLLGKTLMALREEFRREKAADAAVDTVQEFVQENPGLS